MNISDLFPYWPALRPAYPTKVGTLSTILSGPVPSAGTRAVPSDVSGCTLEVASDGKWYGVISNNRSLAWVQALVATPAIASNLSTSGVYAWINNVRWVWNG